MSVIAVPEYVGFASCKITLVRSTRELRSAMTGRRQVVVSAYALWQFEGTLVPLQGVEAGEVRAFLSQLRGRANTFRLPIPAAGVPLSNYAGSAGAVLGASQVGSSIITNGWTASALLLRKGDYFNIGDELKVATSGVTANGSGQATIFFEPPIRTSPANGSAIKVLDPFIYLAAQEDDIAQWGLRDYNTHEIKITALEAFE